MPFVYLEYRSRWPHADLELYHRVLARKVGRWTDVYPDDVMVINAGRSWRIGPEPEYLMGFYMPNHGLERFAQWAEIWRSGETYQMEANSRLAGRIDSAGCYAPLREPVIAESGPYVAEFFDFAPGATRGDVSEYFDQRAAAHTNFTLHLLVDRIGKLGPDPRGFALWGIGDYAALDEIATELDDVTEPITLETMGLYEDLGFEIL
jgi:hypothetical protein